MKYAFNSKDKRADEILSAPTSLWDADGKFLPNVLFFDTDTGHIEQCTHDENGRIVWGPDGNLFRVVTVRPAPLTFEVGIYDDCDRPTAVVGACR